MSNCQQITDNLVNFEQWHSFDTKLIIVVKTNSPKYFDKFSGKE